MITLVKKKVRIALDAFFPLRPGGRLLQKRGFLAATAAVGKIAAACKPPVGASLARRADRAPGRGQAGEELAWRLDLTSRFFRSQTNKPCYGKTKV
jgi:hypothetical protein